MQFLEAVRCQKEVVDDLWKADKNARNLPEEAQKYLALAFYAAIPPSRGKEIRLLADRILTETESRVSSRNHIALIQGRQIENRDLFTGRRAGGVCGACFSRHDDLVP